MENKELVQKGSDIMNSLPKEDRKAVFAWIENYTKKQELNIKLFQDRQKNLSIEFIDLLDKTQRRLWSDKPTRL